MASQASASSSTSHYNSFGPLLSEGGVSIPNVFQADRPNNQSPSSPMSDLSTTSSVEFILDPPTRGFNLPRTVKHTWPNSSSAAPTEVDPNEEQQSTVGSPSKPQNNSEEAKPWPSPEVEIDAKSIDQLADPPSFHSDSRRRRAASTGDSEASATERNNSGEAITEPHLPASPYRRLAVPITPPMGEGTPNSARAAAEFWSKLVLTEGGEKGEHVVMLVKNPDDEGGKDLGGTESSSGLLTPTTFKFDSESQQDMIEINAVTENRDHQVNGHKLTPDNPNINAAVSPEQQLEKQNFICLQQAASESEAAGMKISPSSGSKHNAKAGKAANAIGPSSVSTGVAPSGPRREQTPKAENPAREAAGTVTQYWRSDKDYVPPHRRYVQGAPLAAKIKANEENAPRSKFEDETTTMTDQNGSANATPGPNAEAIIDKKLQWSPRKKKKSHGKGNSTASNTSGERNSTGYHPTLSFAQPSAGNNVANLNSFVPKIDLVFKAQMELLNSEGHWKDGQFFHGNSEAEDVRTTPLFSQDVKNAAADPRNLGKAIEFSQYGLIGGLLEQVDPSQDSPPRESHDGYLRDDSRIFLNVNAPWSAFICGSQGSGKSHTLSCILENSLIKRLALGSLPNPLAAMVFHYDAFSSHSGAQACEVAHLCSCGIPIRVLVSPSNLVHMRKVYANLPTFSNQSSKPEVEPLLLKAKHLNIERMLALMGVNDGSGVTPLYMEVVRKHLRKMAEEGEGKKSFDYHTFKTRLYKEKFSHGQKNPLDIRLDILESFMEFKLAPPNKTEIWDFNPGTLTIVDLSCPFVDETSACMMFDICLKLFLEGDTTVGRIVALDEAHKFMNDSAGANRLSESLTNVIRLQRHLAARVVIATQEPTISPRLLNLCSMTFVHRFTSPEWLRTLSSHLAGASSIAGESDSKEHSRRIFQRIVRLDVGQALLFSPSAMISVRGNAENDKFVIDKLGLDYLKIRVRKRLTSDGGRSIMAT